MKKPGCDNLTGVNYIYLVGVQLYWAKSPLYGVSDTAYYTSRDSTSYSHNYEIVIYQV